MGKTIDLSDLVFGGFHNWVLELEQNLTWGLGLDNFPE